jgi:hypothetical protein
MSSIRCARMAWSSSWVRRDFGWTTNRSPSARRRKPRCWSAHSTWSAHSSWSAGSAVILAAGGVDPRAHASQSGERLWGSDWGSTRNQQRSENADTRERPRRWPFTCCRPDQLHRIGDIHATVVVAAERGARMAHATIAVDPNGDLLSGFQAVKRDAEALVPENRLGCDGELGGLRPNPGDAIRNSTNTVAGPQA